MAIDQQLYTSPAVRGDISGVAIATSIALSAVAEILKNLVDGNQPSAQDIEAIEVQAKKIEKEVLAEIAREELREHRAEISAIRRETQAEFKAINARLAELPTKADLSSWQWQWLAGGLAIVALTTGGLALIAHYVG